ncbi:MAG: hypothetical protein L6R39_002173 [Caloplaca ligustica]|nr:MAG: hypothetical protein L6R39_002173 [Caloplaca ligustica]
MARKLQDRLALASYKTQNGLDHLGLDLVEAHIERRLKRKRRSSSTGTSSDSSSTTSDQAFFSGPLTSSPHTAAMFSDDFPSSTIGLTSSRRPGYNSTTAISKQPLADRKRKRRNSMAPPLIDASRRSWKSAHNLPESSPGSHQHAHFTASHTANFSFASEGSTIANTPPFGPDSDDRDRGQLDHSFSLNTSHFRSSPPCTPPPTRSRRSRSLKRNAAGEEGAELLMHLATSPSPANQGMKSNLHPPSTPPADHQTLPSSVMPMSGASGFLPGFSTPGQNFAWADFINVTPSPAQGAFGNCTPGLPKTPLAAKEARRRLNLDALGSSAGSPTLSNIGRGSTTKSNGLGMELGGELIS